MSLSQILKEMAVTKPIAEADITMENPGTYNARVGLKKASEEQLKYLKLQYRNELRSSLAYIVVTGGQRGAFTELATTDTFGCFSVDPEAFYMDLASRVSPALFGRESIKYMFNIVSNILEDKATELELRSYPMLSFNDKYNRAVNNVQELAEVIKEAINDQVGSELVGLDAAYSVVDMAIQKNHTAAVTPIILSTGDEKLALDLQKNLKRLTSKVFLVVTGKASKSLQLADGAIAVKTVNEDSVGSALSAIKSKLL